MTMFTHLCIYVQRTHRRTRIRYIFSLTPTLKRCNFITVRVEKNLVKTIFVENFTWNNFVLMIFFEKMCCFREKKTNY